MADETQDQDFNLEGMGADPIISDDPSNIGTPPAPPERDQTTGRFVPKTEGEKKSETPKPQAKPPAKTTVPAKPESEETQDETAEEETTEEVEEPSEESEEESEESGETTQQRRDYSQFSAEEQEVLRQLPNRFFNLVAPYLQKTKAQINQLRGQSEELAKLKADPNRLPESYYAHPQAYMLSPEYGQLTSMYGRADYEAQHYMKQLGELENGAEQIQVIQGWQNGQPILQTVPANPQMRYAVIATMNRAQNEASKLADKAEQLAKNFRSGYEQKIKAVDDGAKPHFESLLPELQPKPEDIEAFKKFVPSELHSVPLFDLASKMFSVIMRQGIMLKGLQTQGQASQAVQAEKKKLGPKPAPATPAVKSKKQLAEEINFEDLQKEMETV